MLSGTHKARRVNTRILTRARYYCALTHLQDLLDQTQRRADKFISSNRHFSDPTCYSESPAGHLLMIYGSARAGRRVLVPGSSVMDVWSGHRASRTDCTWKWRKYDTLQHASKLQSAEVSRLHTFRLKHPTYNNSLIVSYTNSNHADGLWTTWQLKKLSLRNQSEL